MRPEVFPEATGTLSGGPAVLFATDQDVKDLPVYRGGGQVISCWRLAWRERLRLLFTGKVWLRILGSNHAPVSVETERPFS